MTITLSERSSLARLVLFIVCLAIAGSFVAGIHYFTVDLPAQKAVQAPANGESCTVRHDNFCARMITSICHAPGVISIGNYYDCLRDLGCCE